MSKELLENVRVVELKGEFRIYFDTDKLMSTNDRRVIKVSKTDDLNFDATRLGIQLGKIIREELV